MKRIGMAIIAGFGVAALVSACTREQSSFVDTPRAGSPAYWESQAPTPTPQQQPQQKAPAQATPAAGTYYPSWPSLDGGVNPDPGPRTMNGTTDPYLWEKGSGTELTAEPQLANATQAVPNAPSQEPMRTYDGADAAGDGVESYTIVGAQPAVRTDDPYADTDVDAGDAGADAADDAALPSLPAKTQDDGYPGSDGALP